MKTLSRIDNSFYSLFSDQNFMFSHNKWSRMIFAVIFAFCCITAFADEPLKAGKMYSISCKYASGYVSLGSVHGVSYPLYYVKSDALADSDDGYWYVEGNEEDGYRFKNVATSEYMIWCDDYSRCRYLDVASEAGDYARWSLEAAADGYYVIRSKAEPGYTFNLRTGTFQLGTYSGSYGDSNSLFKFEEVEDAWEDVPWERYDGYFWPADVETTTIVRGKFAEGTVWYKLSVRNGKQIYSEGENVLCDTYDTKDEAPYYWCFVKNDQNLYRVYNYATGPMRPMSVFSSVNEMPLLLNGKGEHTCFNLTDNVKGWSNGLNFKIPNVESYGNDFADRGVMKLWADTQGNSDDGSRIILQRIGEVNIDIDYDDDKDDADDEDQDGDAEFVELPHGDGYIYILGAHERLTVIARDYVEATDLDGGKFTATLKGGLTYEQFGVLEVSDEMPCQWPTFTSFEFDNKLNHQLFTDVKAADATQHDIDLKVGAIGKRLTATFGLSDEKAQVWVGEKVQENKVSRLRYEDPVCFTIGYNNWKEVVLGQQGEGEVVSREMPFGYKTTVNVDWLSDHPTTEYGVPVIYITTDNGTSITSKDYYWDAKMEIDGAGVFPDMALTQMQIKGRGNSTWGGWGSKNPYRLKFPLKVKPFGLPKSKSWVLLSNKQNGSMTTNAMGQKIAHMMGSVGACDIIPVELYINGQYQGSYNFTEKVGFSNSSVDLDDDTYAAMIELDTYGDAGETTFYSNAYGIASKVHDPDVEEYDYDGLLDVYGIIEDFNEMTRMVRAHDGSYVNKVDVNALVGYLATAELMCHSEMKHPKSVFIYSENVTDEPNAETGVDDTPWVLGPLWDCDWAFGYEQKNRYYEINETEDFFSDLLGNNLPKSFWNDLRYGSEEVDNAYFARWKKFMTEGGLDELLEYCDDYYAFAAKSLSHNNSQVTTNWDTYDYADVTQKCRNWLQKRAEHVYAQLKSTHPDDDETEEKTPIDMALVDGEEINITEEQPCNTLTYTRNFKNTNWQPLYVPFTMSFEDWDEQGLEVARLNGFYEYDDDQNGTVDRSALEVIKVKGGQLKPNHPYLVRAAATGQKTITTTNTSVLPTTTNYVDCATVETLYTFTGSYQQIAQSQLNKWNAYVMSGGSLRQSASALNSMRWYMTRTSRSGQLLPEISEIKVIVQGEEDVDAVIDMAAENEHNASSSQLYNLNGQRVERATGKGIYIRDGKKLSIVR